MTTPSSGRTFWKAFGPGLLFAGAAVGVSHLVQSTRAGADYGLSLAGIILIANLLKYPALRFGPLYAAATGRSLLEGYRRQGRAALVVYGLLTVGTMFTIEAAVTVVTAGLAKTTLGLSASTEALSAGLIAVCAGLLAWGRYQWLDRVVKVVVAILTVSTLAATAMVLPQIHWQESHWWPDVAAFTKTDLFFIAALVGWMPTAIDVSVWHSLWTLARGRDAGYSATPREALLDFDIGYFGTALLAFCFLLLGAAVMHGRGIAFASNAGGFANQIIELYAKTLGDWSRPLISICAFATMFSTTLTVVDGFPRTLSVLLSRFRGPEGNSEGPDVDGGERRDYWLALVVLGGGSLAVLTAFIGALKAMVDLATTLSFLTAPILALLNHRAVHSSDVAAAHRPSKAMTFASWTAITFFTFFAVAYLLARFAS